MSVNTKKVQGRRELRFGTVAALRREVENLAAADRNGRLRSAGNWTLGQALGHLATWVGYAYVEGGAPVRLNWVMRLILKGAKRRLIERTMPAGVRLPGVPGGTLGAEPIPTEEGVAKLLPLLSRLDSEPPTQKHPIFGHMTHDEWRQLHLRHAELHLGFFTVG